MNYNKKSDFSYTLGAYPTLELGFNRPELVRVIYLHPLASQKIKDKVYGLSRENNLEVLEGPNFFKGLEKDNVFLAAKFDKYRDKIQDKRHLILHRPEQLGNLGTILRTALAFGLEDIAVIEPSCDRFHPSCIRASMGAHFSLRVESFPSMEDYEKAFKREIYAFMTGDHPLLKEVNFEGTFSLLFGSESSGLPEDFSSRYKPIKIKMSPRVDSLNLSLAVGISLHHIY